MEPSLQDLLDEIRRIRVSHQAGLKFSDLPGYVGVSESTIRRMLKQPGAPQRRAFQTDENGNAVQLYLRTEIDAWMKSAPISRAS